MQRAGIEFCQALIVCQYAARAGAGGTQQDGAQWDAWAGCGSAYVRSQVRLYLLRWLDLMLVVSVRVNVKCAPAIGCAVYRGAKAPVQRYARGMSAG